MSEVSDLITTQMQYFIWHFDIYGASAIIDISNTLAVCLIFCQFPFKICRVLVKVYVCF